MYGTWKTIELIAAITYFLIWFLYVAQVDSFPHEVGPLPHATNSEEKDIYILFFGMAKK